MGEGGDGKGMRGEGRGREGRGRGGEGRGERTRGGKRRDNGVITVELCPLIIATPTLTSPVTPNIQKRSLRSSEVTVSSNATPSYRSGKDGSLYATKHNNIPTQFYKRAWALIQELHHR